MKGSEGRVIRSDWEKEAERDDSPLAPVHPPAGKVNISMEGPKGSETKVKMEGKSHPQYTGIPLEQCCVLEVETQKRKERETLHPDVL
jgi:hypothetical protein